jgi:hypothetical protein
VVFDDVNHPAPRAASFVESVLRRVPVWILARSDRLHDLGSLWPLAGEFARLELRPFRSDETRALIQAVIACGLAPPDSLNHASWLHRRAGGNPGRLRALLVELGIAKHDLATRQGRRLLELDCGIRELKRRLARENDTS